MYAQWTVYAGAAGGISTLSADARSMLTPDIARVSQYKPENGPAVDVFAGVHWNDYFGTQADFIWNRNDLALLQTAGAAFLEHAWRGSHKTVSADALLYFRGRQSWARPYLSAGLGVTRYRAALQRVRVSRGTIAFPPDEIESTRPSLRVAVGIDIRLGRSVWWRYSFAETIQKNPVSKALSPPGERNLANFQNLFGFVKTF